ncbi:hypothetical protein E4U40_002041 [Claviceps sp. LM458 group G5]|nr:hypothetical protein E4U40_002041 [Claviceps sp. LM458 group G5]
MSISALAASMVAKIQSLDTASDWTSWKKSIIDILGIAGYGDLLKGESDATWVTPEGVSATKALSGFRRKEVEEKATGGMPSCIQLLRFRTSRHHKKGRPQKGSGTYYRPFADKLST